MDRDVLKSMKHYFVKVPSNNLPINYFDDLGTNVNIMSVSELKLIDEMEGCYYTAENQVLAFILAPWIFTLESGS